MLEHFTEVNITSCHACKLSDFVSNTPFVALTPNKNSEQWQVYLNSTFQYTHMKCAQHRRLKTITQNPIFTMKMTK